MLNFKYLSMKSTGMPLLSSRELSEKQYLDLMPPVFHKIYGPMAMPAARLLWRNSGPVFAVDAMLRAYGEIWPLEGPLGIAEKCLATVAALVAQELHPQIKLHLNGFISAGGTTDELIDVVNLVAQRAFTEVPDDVIDAVATGLQWRAQCLPDFEAPSRAGVAAAIRDPKRVHALSQERQLLVAVSTEIGLGRKVEVREAMKMLAALLPADTKHDRYMDQLITHLIVYCGYPKGMNAFYLWQDLRAPLVKAI